MLPILIWIASIPFIPIALIYFFKGFQTIKNRQITSRSKLWFFAVSFVIGVISLSAILGFILNLPRCDWDDPSCSGTTTPLYVSLALALAFGSAIAAKTLNTKSFPAHSKSLLGKILLIPSGFILLFFSYFAIGGGIRLVISFFE